VNEKRKRKMKTDGTTKEDETNLWYKKAKRVEEQSNKKEVCFV